MWVGEVVPQRHALMTYGGDLPSHVSNSARGGSGSHPGNSLHTRWAGDWVGPTAGIAWPETKIEPTYFRQVHTRGCCTLVVHRQKREGFQLRPEIFHTVIKDGIFRIVRTKRNGVALKPMQAVTAVTPVTYVGTVHRCGCKNVPSCKLTLQLVNYVLKNSSMPHKTKCSIQNGANTDDWT
jgi:hypothetical protein